VGLALAEISGDTPEDYGSNTVRGRTVLKKDIRTNVRIKVKETTVLLKVIVALVPTPTPAPAPA
jgi:hypothetical protein